MAFVLRKHKKKAALIAALVLITLAAALLPKKAWLENRIKSALEAQGFSNVELTLSRIGPSQMILKDVRLGGAAGLVLKDITLHYSIMGLLSGKLRDLTATGLAVNLHKENDVWKISGFEQKERKAEKAAPFSLPVTLDALPLNSAQLTDSSAHIASGPWQMGLPVNLTWQKEPTPKLLYAATGLAFYNQSLRVSSGEASVDASLDAEKSRWQGQWKIKNIQVEGLSVPMPPLSAHGALLLQAARGTVTGQIQSDDGSYKATFETDYIFAAPDKSALTIKDAAMPWNEGRVSTRNVRIPLIGKGPLSLDLQINRVSADALMQQLTGKRATASGKISGTLPLTIESDGSFAFHQGMLRAEGPGSIAVSPEVISGTNEKVSLVRDVLQDFRYTSLSILLSQSQDRGLELVLRLEGANPNVQQGRPVKLNVTLRGDVVGFIQKNLLWLNDPKKLMERGINANP